MDAYPYTNNYPDPIRQSDRDDFDAIDSLSDGDVDIYADRNTDGNGNLVANADWFSDSYDYGDPDGDCDGDRDPHSNGYSDANPYLY